MVLRDGNKNGQNVERQTRAPVGLPVYLPAGGDGIALGLTEVRARSPEPLLSS